MSGEAAAPPPRPAVGRTGAGGGRDTEWLSAFLMCAFALVLSLPGDSLAGPAFSFFHRLGLNETVWAFAFGATGSLRVAALYINGRSPRTPYARMLGAFLGFLGWGEVGVLVQQGTAAAFGVAAPDAAIYGLLAAMELRSLYRASYDARYIAH